MKNRWSLIPLFPDFWIISQATRYPRLDCRGSFRFILEWSYLWSRRLRIQEPRKRSLRLDVFYPHLNLIPEASHLVISFYTRNISQFFREKNISNRRSPRISLHLFKTLFRLERSKKGKRKRNQSLVIFQVVVHQIRMERAAAMFVHRCFRRVNWPRFIHM